MASTASYATAPIARAAPAEASPQVGNPAKADRLQGGVVAANNRALDSAETLRPLPVRKAAAGRLAGCNCHLHSNLVNRVRSSSSIFGVRDSST